MMQQRLTDVFLDVNRRNIKYCLLRGADELSIDSHKKEIDLLVLPDYIHEFTMVVKQLGFVTLPSWGHAPHHFFLAYEKNSDTWIKLDVVTTLVYGRPLRYLHLELAESFAENRISHEILFTLSPQHEFFTLFLHCLLDKGSFAFRHRSRLVDLLRIISKNKQYYSEIGNLFNTYFPDLQAWEHVEHLIKNNDWKEVMHLERPFCKKLFQRHSVKNTGFYLRNRLQRRLRPLLFTLYRHGLSIVLLAPDGAGKSTLAEKLAAEDVFRARLIYMGSNIDAATVSLPTTRLFKSLIKNTGSGSKLITKPLKAAGYINRLIEQWLRIAVGIYHKTRGRFIIFDRYVYDSYLAPPPQSFSKRLRRSLLLKTSIRPDLVFFLDAPGDILFKRKGEHTPERLEKQRQTFLRLKDRIPEMQIIDATRSASQVRSEVIDVIWNHYAAITD